MIIKEAYIDPDRIWCDDDDATAFIYDSGHMLYSDIGGTHSMIIANELDVYRPWEAGNEATEEYVANVREEWEATSLFGRVGYTRDGKQVVSFWNGFTSKDLYQTLLKPCIQQLLNDELVTADTIISTPYGNSTVENPLEHTENSDGPINPEDLEMLKALHLMPPEQKKEALMKMNAVGGHKHPWQQAFEQEKIVTPGQKWWTPTSESRQ